MHQDFKELLSAFNAGQVRYLIVGGYAVSFHAQPRATKDLDILIGADAENSKAVYAALAKFGAPIEGLSAKDFAEPSARTIRQAADGKIRGLLTEGHMVASPYWRVSGDRRWPRT